MDAPSPQVDWTPGAVELLTEARPWPATDRPRRAGVSSFGISGTNAHVILEQAPDSAATEQPARGRRGRGRAVGALRPDARRRCVLRRGGWRRYLEARPGAVAGGRRLLAGDHAVAVRAPRGGHRRDRPRNCSPGCARSPRDGRRGGGDGRGSRRVRGPTGVRVPGAGFAVGRDGAELLESSPVFAARMAECAAALESFADWSLLDVLGDAAALERVDVVQPALFAVMVSLAAVWRSYGVEPAAVVGHSQGEIAAAVVAGALSLEDGARVVALRSKAIAEVLAGGGGMVSVALPVAQVRDRLAVFGESVSIAAVNGPSSTVVSGTSEALDGLLAGWEKEEVRARRIPVDYASHSAQVEDLRERILADLGPVRPRESSVPLFSTVTGEWLDSAPMDAGYWLSNLRQTVRFEEAVRALADQGFGAFIECSAHPVLTIGIQETIEDAVVTGSLRRDEGGARRMLTSLAEACVRGVPVDWTSAFAGAGARRVDLPTYAFQRQRYWWEPRAARRRRPARCQRGGRGVLARGRGRGPPVAGGDPGRRRRSRSRRCCPR